jgi:hypothetical protein
MYRYTKRNKSITAHPIDCVSSLAHESPCIHKFDTFLGEDPIGNKPLVCTKCKSIRLGEYTEAINARRLQNCTYELFEDIATNDDLLSFNIHKKCDCENKKDKRTLAARLLQIQTDFRTLCAEKIYIKPFKNKLEAAAALRLQGYFPEEIRVRVSKKMPWYLWLEQNQDIAKVYYLVVTHLLSHNKGLHLDDLRDVLQFTYLIPYHTIEDFIHFIITNETLGIEFPELHGVRKPIVFLKPIEKLSLPIGKHSVWIPNKHKNK